MDQIISEHFGSIDNYRNFALIFEIECPFVKENTNIYCFEMSVFISLDEEIEYSDVEGYEGISLNYKKEGFGIDYNDDGSKWKEGNYQNGKEEELWIFWWPNGQKRSEGNYRNGKAEGLCVYWGKNGQKQTEGNCRNGEKEGLWIYWYESDQKWQEENYQNGKLIDQTIF